MVRFVEGQSNQLKVYVASSIDTTGFSIKVNICGGAKTISDIKDNVTYTLEYSAEDVSTIPSLGIYGSIEVLDKDGNVYQSATEKVEKVSSSQEYLAIDHRFIPITIAANWVGEAPTGEWGDFSGLEDPDASVNSIRKWSIRLNNILRGL